MLCAQEAFNACELDKAFHLSGNVYNDSMVTMKVREDIRSRYSKHVYFLISLRENN